MCLHSHTTHVPAINTNCPVPVQTQTHYDGSIHKRMWLPHNKYTSTQTHEYGRRNMSHRLRSHAHLSTCSTHTSNCAHMLHAHAHVPHSRVLAYTLHGTPQPPGTVRDSNRSMLIAAAQVLCRSFQPPCAMALRPFLSHACRMGVWHGCVVCMLHRKSRAERLVPLRCRYDHMLTHEKRGLRMFMCGRDLSSALQMCARLVCKQTCVRHVTPYDARAMRHVPSAGSPRARRLWTLGSCRMMRQAWRA